MVKGRLKSLREARGYSIKSICLKLGMSELAYLKYENDDYELLPLAFVDTLASALGTSYAYLMGYTDEVLSISGTSYDYLMLPTNKNN